MKPKISVYVTDGELAQLKREAARRRISLSRYAKERLVVRDESDSDTAAERSDSVRKMLAERADGLAENLRTVIVMLDQLVRSTLTYLPEIPEAQKERVLAAGDRRHRGWQQEVETLLRQMRSQPAAERQRATGNGAHA
jgi:hypothetical protein